MNHSLEELIESKKQIVSLLHKLRETILSLQSKPNQSRYKSQLTLAQRRIRAMEVSLELIEEKISHHTVKGEKK